MISIIAAFVAGVVATAVGFVVANRRKPEAVDKVEEKVRSFRKK